MGAEYTKSQANASLKYLKGFDEIKVRVQKGKKDEYRKIAESEGKSLNQFVIGCIEKEV